MNGWRHTQVHGNHPQDSREESALHHCDGMCHQIVITLLYLFLIKGKRKARIAARQSLAKECLQSFDRLLNDLNIKPGLLYPPVQF